MQRVEPLIYTILKTKLAHCDQMTDVINQMWERTLRPGLSILTIVQPLSRSQFHNFLLAIAAPSGRTRNFAHAICRCARPPRPQSSR